MNTFTSLLSDISRISKISIIYDWRCGCHITIHSVVYHIHYHSLLCNSVSTETYNRTITAQNTS
jgi:hypothetical protein